MKLAWGARVSQDFRDRVVRIAARIGCDPSWLMACTAFETGRTFDPAKRNPVSTATGLIQFMAFTARDLNTSTEALAKMSAVEQLDYVGRYFQPFAGRLHSLSDTYMAILWPAAVGKPDAEVIFKPGSKAYLANRGLDIDHDGAVTKGEAAAFVVRMLAEGMQPSNVYEAETQPAAPIEERSIPSEERPMGAGLLAAILPQVLQLFSGKAQQKIAETTGASPDIAAQFMQALIGKVGLAVGLPVINDATATQAVGTFASKSDPAAIKALEADALMSLEELLRVTDRASEYDKIKWQAEMDGRDAAARRALGERWDMTPYLVMFAGGTVTLMILGLIGAILYQSMSKGIDPVLLGLGGPLLGIGFACYKAIFDYRFDGTKDSGAQSDALMKVVASRNEPAGK